MSKKKVIIAGKLPPPYIGPAIATKIILNSALKEQFDLLHLDTTINKTVSDFGKGGSSKIFKNIAVYRNLIQLIRENRPELIHIPISQTTIGFLKDSAFILIASLLRVKIVLQLRGSNFKNWMKTTNGLTQKYVRFCLQKSAGMIVLGNNLRHLFEDYYKPEQIFVVPNGCDIQIPEAERQDEVVRVLYFANFLPSKGIREVLKAMVLLKAQRVVNFELNAVGAWDNDEYKKECLRIVERNDLTVSFNQPMSGDMKWQAFANADVFIFTPNMPEGHPWVIVEALAAALPIISTDQGAILESVLHEKNGYIVDSNSTEEIANRLLELIQDESKRSSMGNESYKIYKQNFTEGNMVQNLAITYNDILKEDRSNTLQK